MTLSANPGRTFTLLEGMQAALGEYSGLDHTLAALPRQAACHGILHQRDCMVHQGECMEKRGHRPVVQLAGSGRGLASGRGRVVKWVSGGHPSQSQTLWKAQLQAGCNLWGSATSIIASPVAIRGTFFNDMDRICISMDTCTSYQGRSWVHASRLHLRHVRAANGRGLGTIRTVQWRAANGRVLGAIRTEQWTQHSRSSGHRHSPSVDTVAMYSAKGGFGGHSTIHR